jgi:type I restriction enzyme, S subunit
MLRNIEVPIPSISEQKRIAEILSAYDDLIENNRRRIHLLEQAARLLYKEWFVHLRFPGHEHTKIIDGVPQGWEKKSIDERFETVLGGTPARNNSEFWGGNIPWINSGEVNNTRILKPTELITEKGLLKSAAKIMPAGTTVLAITGATLGQVSRLEIECSANQSVVGVFDLADPKNEWLYLFFSHEIKKIINHATGGAQQHINKEIVNATEFLEPSKSVLEIFRQIVRPIFSQIKCLELQNLSLIKARNLLLPKLMNGEVTV